MAHGVALLLLDAHELGVLALRWSQLAWPGEGGWGGVLVGWLGAGKTDWGLEASECETVVKIGGWRLQRVKLSSRLGVGCLKV